MPIDMRNVVHDGREAVMTTGRARARLEVFRGSDPSMFFWRLRAGNGETMCVSEAFPSKSNAVRAAARALELFEGGDVELTTDTPDVEGPALARRP